MEIRRNIVDREVLEIATDEDITIDGRIDGHARVTLESGGAIIITGKIDNRSVVSLTAEGDITIGTTGEPGDRKVDGGSRLTCVSRAGSIGLGGKVDGGSVVRLDAARNIAVGATGGPGDRKVDGGSELSCVARGGAIALGGKIDGNSLVHLTASGPVELFMREGRDPDGKVGGKSRLTCVSERRGVRLNGRVVGESEARLTAAEDVLIDSRDEEFANWNDDLRAFISARAGRDVQVNGSLLRKRADLGACRHVALSGSIDLAAHVRLSAVHGSIVVRGAIRGPGTSVTVWPEGRLAVDGGTTGATVVEANWAGDEARCGGPGPREGTWWQNWPWTFGYVADRAMPRTLDELSAVVAAPGEGVTAIKAVGGGWSFTDASLPCRSLDEVARVSLQRRGAAGHVNMAGVLEGLGETVRPMDVHPFDVARAVTRQSRYDQETTERRLASGPLLPALEGVKVIDTRAMASSLQPGLAALLTDAARASVASGRHYFHVEAGITIANLNVLLDHHHPRLALQASGGSPGATLAGTIATATHGGEFRWPLLVDQVRALHLVGPGGHQWWIEGAESIADPDALLAAYPGLDRQRIVAGDWHGVEGLTAADVLRAVVVSMGTMGVVYSVVIEVVPQFGLQQVVVPVRDWNTLVAAAGTSVEALQANRPGASRAVLEYLLDGALNGTGIARDDNVYVDLAINPITKRCWIFNRRVTPELPVDSRDLPLGANDMLDRITSELEKQSQSSTLGENHFLGRVFDFLHWGTENHHHLNNLHQAARLARFVTGFPDLLAAAVATASVQAKGNATYSPGQPDRGARFLGDILTALLDALSGTTAFGRSDLTGIAYQVGAIGWPATGVPGRALEVALPIDEAFSFVQTVLVDEIIADVIERRNHPVVGYVSIRVCPPTATLMGMPQFAPYSVMVEVVAYRSPEANVVMNHLARRIEALIRERGLRAMLHWGLETDDLSADTLLAMPVADPLREGSRFTRLSAFRAVRDLIRGDATPVFDNYFSQRLGL